MKTIGWLMLLSQLMLLLFVAEWIRMQYSAGEKRLDEDIRNIFARTEEQLTNDTIDRAVAVILDQLPVPSSQRHVEIGYKTGSPVRVNVMNRDTGVLMLPHLSTAVSSKEKANPGIHIKRLEMQGGSKADSAILPDVLKQVLRVTVQQAAGDKGLWGDGFFAPVDSAAFRKAFAAALRQKQLPADLRWDTTAIRTGAPPPFRYQSAGFRGTASLSLSGHHAYLLRNLLPQAGFSAVLLLLTAMAFLLAYRNMSRQAKFSEQKDNFISNMSHELKTPVATAKVALEALSTYNALEDPVRSRKYLQIATWETGRLETLINRIMNTIMAEDGHISLDKAPVSLAGMLQEITGMLQPLLQQRSLLLHIGSGAAQLTVMADRMHLQGAVYNLLDNAVKYGGRRIDVTLKEEGSSALLRISDDGPGIPAAYRKRIFEKFFRVPQGDRHDVKGHGLGLSYARYVVQAHGGRLVLEEGGPGATFTIALPLYPTRL